MTDMIDMLLNKYGLFLLVLLRTSGIFIVSPFFSAQNIPNVVKIGFTVFTSIIITLVLDVDVQAIEISLLALIAKELMIGMTIGFICYLFASTFYTMGQIVDMSMGFGMVNVVDPKIGFKSPLWEIFITYWHFCSYWGLMATILLLGFWLIVTTLFLLAILSLIKILLFFLWIF